MSVLLQPHRFAAAAFAPTDIAGLKAWFKADGTLYQDSARTTLAAADADPVGSWSDGSGQNNHASQATAGSRPLLKLGILNGRPVIRFDGANDRLQTAAFGAALAQPNTVFVVAKRTGGGAEAFLDGRTDATHLFRKNVGGSYNLYAGGDFVVVAADANWHIVQGVFNGASSKARVDGGAAATGNAGTSSMDGATVGSRANSSEWMNGDIAEILIYNANLSLAQLDQVGNYLAGRYGLAWSAAS